MGSTRYAAVVLAVSFVLLAACKAEIEPGPLTDRLDSPAGIAVLGSSHLLVTNANFQLRYSGGSLAAIDLGAVDELQRVNDTASVISSFVELPSFSGPVAIDPTGTRALITNRLSAEDRRSSPDRVLVVDVADPFVLGAPESITVERDPYGILPIRLPPSGPGRPVRDRAFVANSTEGTISVLALTEGTLCAGGEPAPCVDDIFPPPRATEPEFFDAGNPAELTFSGPGLAPGLSRNEHWTVTFIEAPGVCPVPGSPEIPTGYWRVEGSASGVLRSHACTGLLYIGDNLRVTFTIRRVADDAGVLVGAPPTDGDTYEFDTFEGDLDAPSSLRLHRSLPSGTIFGRGVGHLIHDPFRGRIYASSRRTNFIYVLDAEDYRYLGAFAIVTNVGGIDSRGLALSPDGEMLYVVNRSPSALLMIDPDAMEDRLEQQIVVDGVVDSIPMDLGGSEIALTPDGGFAFVSSIDADSVDVLDLQTRSLAKVIPTSDGPFALTMSPDGRRVYVATYFDHAIEVIDSEPGSPTFGEVITTLANADFDPDR